MLKYVSCFCLLLKTVTSDHLIGLPGGSQFHAQDVLGQYSYGYNGGPSAKVESRTADGVTRGGYSYIDANGILQSVNYVSDPINGFRVAATNLPQAPLPEALKTVQPIPEVKFTPENIKTAPDTIAALSLAAIPNLFSGPNVLAGLQLHALPTLNLTPEDQKLASILTPEELKSAIPTVKSNDEELKSTSVNAIIPDVRPSVISAAPALKLIPLSVPAYNLSPLGLTYPTAYVTYVSPDLYQTYGPQLSQPDVKLQLEVPKEEKQIETANKERTKRDVYYSPAVLAILRSRHQHLVRDKFGNLILAYPQPVAADIKPLGSPAYIF